MHFLIIFTDKLAFLVDDCVISLQSNEQKVSKSFESAASVLLMASASVQNSRQDQLLDARIIFSSSKTINVPFVRWESYH